MYRDSSGRIVQLADASGDTWKADLTRTYAMVSCACPPAGPPPQQQPPPSLSHRELFRMILQNIRRANCLSVALISELAEFAALDACMTYFWTRRFPYLLHHPAAYKVQGCSTHVDSCAREESRSSVLFCML